MGGQLAPWNMLAKKQIWQQLGPIQGKRILDFGSGEGVTANYLAANNEVIAVEPDAEAIKNRLAEHTYTQITGGLASILPMPDASFDIILCHNVLEYIVVHQPVWQAFERLLKPGGMLSVAKHNRAGRVMQMVVLLNNFEHAAELLDGLDGRSQEFGAIHYYEDDEPVRSASSFFLEKMYGIRTFWHLQQNQEIHEDAAWQHKMLHMEQRVSSLPEYQSIAFFHHLILRKKNTVG